jgi:hypothetical protein
MDFGLFTMFSSREGVTQFHTFREWFELMQAAEDMGLDTVAIRKPMNGSGASPR